MVDWRDDHPFRDIAVLFRTWVAEGKVSFELNECSWGDDVDYHICWLYGLKPKSGQEKGDFYDNYIAHFNDQVRLGRINIDWVYSPHAYALYKVLLARKQDEKH